MTDVTAEEKEGIVTYGYGHIADGDVHLNIAIPGFDKPDLMKRLNTNVWPFVMDWIKQSKGSVGAEHGMGVVNQPYLDHSKSPEMIEVMKMIKKGMDPNGIMNPYKVFS